MFVDRPMSCTLKVSPRRLIWRLDSSYSALGDRCFQVSVITCLVPALARRNNTFRCQWVLLCARLPPSFKIMFRKIPSLVELVSNKE
jgi:hypothetical protein